MITKEKLTELAIIRDGKKQAYDTIVLLVFDTTDIDAVVAYDIQKRLASFDYDTAAGQYSTALRAYIANHPDATALAAESAATVDASVAKAAAAAAAKVGP